MFEWIFETWPWYVSGPLIGLTVPILLLTGNKQLGISSSLRHICSACIPSKSEYLNYDWKKQRWNLIFALGLVLGGFLSDMLLTNSTPVEISVQTKQILQHYGITQFSGLLPAEFFNFDLLFATVGIVFVMLGGFLVGFGTRYANGCTSGHTIMGVANLKLSSLLASISFFIGGLFMTYFIYPLLLG